MDHQSQSQHFNPPTHPPYQPLQPEQLLEGSLHQSSIPFTHNILQQSSPTTYQAFSSFAPVPIPLPYAGSTVQNALSFRNGTSTPPRFYAADSGTRPQAPARISLTQSQTELQAKIPSPSKRVGDPPQLHDWREKLFAVDELMALTQDEFETYFPYVDNVYSHRSTQRYKRNPFVAQYWDCRLKGRPPGTKKSDDPNKKKRKRVARERDQCDVKIKIIEFFPGVVQRGHGFAMCSTVEEPRLAPGRSNHVDASPATAQSGQDQGWTMPLISAGGKSIPEASAAGQKIYTIQRVNGSSILGRTEPIIATTHRHTLQYSDEIKRCSILREREKDEKDRRKVQPSTS